MTQAKRRQTSADEEPSPIPDEPTAKDDLSTETDGVQYIFGGCDWDTQSFIVVRSAPATFQGVDIRGYLDDLRPEDTEKSIRDRFGGGTYILQAKDRASGRIVRSKTLQIAGVPRLPETEAPKPAPAEVRPAYSVRVGETDIPYTGSLREAESFLLFLKGVKALFPDPVSINDRLLEVLLAQKNPDVLDTLREAKQLTELVTPVQTDGYIGIIERAIEQAGGVLQALVRNRPAPSMASSRLPAGSKAGVPLVTPPAEQPAKPIESQSEGETMNEKTVIASIAGQLCQAFRLRPPMPVGDIVSVLDDILGITPAVARMALTQNYGQRLKRFCELELAQDFDHEVGSREDFGVYFDDVLETYAKTDRKVGGDND